MNSEKQLPESSPKKKYRLLSIVSLAVLIVLVYFLDILIPATSGWKMLVTVIEKGSVYALVAASMNLLNGFTGLFSLGQAGFMMIGAYVYAILAIPADQHESVYQYFDGGLIRGSFPGFLQNLLGGAGSVGGTAGRYIGMLLLMILAGLIAAGIAFLIGIPVLRLKSDYLAIASLGFAEILRAFFQWNTLGPVTNGSNVLRKYAVYDNAIFPLIIAGAGVLLIMLLINSTFGRSFKAIRDDEIAAEAMGINLFRHKELAFVISSFFAGIGGALLAMFQNTISATPFTSSMTYEILLIVVVGGIGSISGSVIGAFLFIATSEWWLRGLDSGSWLGISASFMRPGFRKVIFSVIIICIVLFFSKGIMGTGEFSWEAVLRFFKQLPASLRDLPASIGKRAAKRRELRAEKLSLKRRRESSARGEKSEDGPKFTPLSLPDEILVFDRKEE